MPQTLPHSAPTAALPDAIDRHIGPGPVDAKVFRAIFQRHPASATILTADDGTGPCAMTITSLISLNADPALVGFSLSHQSNSTKKILKAGRVAIHFLDPSHIALGRLCATPGVDRFEDTTLWSRLADGTPRFHDVGCWFIADIERTLELDGATFVAARLIEGVVDGERSALLYASGGWRGLGEEIQ